MKKLQNQMILAAVCLILGILIALQFKTVQTNYLKGAAPGQKAKELREELTALKEEKQRLLQEIEILDENIKDIETKGSKEDFEIESIRRQIESYDMILGNRDLIGGGIIITVKEPILDPELEFGISYLATDFELLLNLINKLYQSGAEAVSVNEQRMLSDTSIHLLDQRLYIDSVPIAPPFVIKAIGNSQRLESQLEVKYGTLWNMRERYGLEVSVEKVSEVYIPSSKEIKDYQYTKPADNQ
ncbi:MAG: DUF881 domain-containing protein [Bacillota bacterium]